MNRLLDKIQNKPSIPGLKDILGLSVGAKPGTTMMDAVSNILEQRKNRFGKTKRKYTTAGVNVLKVPGALGTTEKRKFFDGK